MKIYRPLQILSSLVAALAGLAAGVGLFWSREGTPFFFTTLRGEQIEMYGQGLYRYDTFFKGPILQGTDAVTLFVWLPLLVAAIVAYSRGSLRGGILLAGLLGYMLYYAVSLAFGVAFNELFLVYVGLFSTSLFAFVLALSVINPSALAGLHFTGLSHWALALFMFAAGLSVFIWFIDIVGGLVENRAPEGLASYTTEVTYVMDLAIIAPAAFLAGILLLKRRPIGYLLSALLLVLNALIGLVVVAQTVMQARSGIALTIGQLIAFVGVFVIMSLLAALLLLHFLRKVAAIPEKQLDYS